VKRLLVRGPNWIGDAVMCEPALAALRPLFPAAEITLLVKPAIAELFKGHPGVDRILVYEDPGRHAGLAGKWALANAIRRARFQLAILFQNAFEAALLTFLAGIPARCGYATDGRGFLLTDSVAVPTRTKISHQVHYYLDLLRPLGAVTSAVPPRLYLTDEEEGAMAVKLADAGVGGSDFVVGLNPGSVYGGAKRWLPERFAETAERLIQDCQAGTGRTVRVVIVGARGEEGLGHVVAQKMPHAPVVLSGRTTVRELMAVIKRCGLFLTNDTGPMHIAAAFNVPLVAVFGPTDARSTAPFGNSHSIVRQPVECSPCLLRECPIDHRCMTRVTVERVHQAAVEKLKVGKLESCTIRQPSTFHTSLKGITVFLDRDGTMNRDTGYVKTPDDLELFSGVVEAVARLNRAGARVVVVTNQSGLARGLVTPAALEAIHARLRGLLEEGGASLDGIYFCPHHPDEDCVCRKPQTAMVDRAAAQLGLDPAGYYLVGDKRLDMELGRRIGARSILVTTGPASQDHLASLRAGELAPDYVAAGFSEAVDWIFEDVRSRQLSAISGQPSAVSFPEDRAGKPTVLKADS
jgi:heptosyltransferase-2